MASMRVLKERTWQQNITGVTQNVRDAYKTLRGYVKVIGLLNWFRNSLLMMKLTYRQLSNF